MKLSLRSKRVHVSSLANVETKTEKADLGGNACYAGIFRYATKLLSVLCYAGPKKGTSNQSFYAVKENKRPRLLTDYGKSHVFLRQA